MSQRDACIRLYGVLAQEMAALGHRPVDVKTEKKMSLAERASYEAAKQRGLQAAGLG